MLDSLSLWERVGERELMLAPTQLLPSSPALPRGRREKELRIIDH
jgi:hypothetical protein